MLVRPAGRTYLGVKVPCTPGKGKVLAKSKGVPREGESEGSRRQNAAPMNKNRIRGTETEMRRPTTSKPSAF